MFSLNKKIRFFIKIDCRIAVIQFELISMQITVLKINHELSTMSERLQYGKIMVRSAFLLYANIS